MLYVLYCSSSTTTGQRFCGEAGVDCHLADCGLGCYRELCYPSQSFEEGVTKRCEMRGHFY